MSPLRSLSLLFFVWSLTLYTQALVHGTRELWIMAALVSTATIATAKLSNGSKRSRWRIVNWLRGEKPDSPNTTATC